MDFSTWTLRARDDQLPFQALIDSQHGYALVTYNMSSSNPVKRSVLGHHVLHKEGFSFNRNWTGD
jgi:hypothetical protein